MKKYRNAVETDDFSESNAGVKKGNSFNVLWSNIQVLLPALFSRVPEPEVERIHKDSDPVGQLAAEIAERCVSYSFRSQSDRLRYQIRQCVLDRLLVGRGQGHLQYKTEFQEAKDENGEPLIDEANEAIKTPKPNTERVEFNHSYFTDYLESPARNQYEVRWRAFKFYKTRAELVSELGAELGNAVALGQDEGGKKKEQDGTEFLQQAEIWAIQDLDSKQYLWISEGYKDAPLKQLDDPYKLENFWCCPIPLVATTTSESTIPTADYVIYEGLADELNYISKRLRAMVECVKMVGAVAEAFSKDVKKITKLADGEAWPMPNWGGFVEKGGFKGIIDWLPFDQCVAAIPVLSNRWMEVKGMIDEITSMPDIVRGSSDPNDPVYSQQQKSHWTVIKLVDKQEDVQRFCAEIARKYGELIFEPGLFSDETIYLMGGVAQMSPKKQQMAPAALQLLRDDRLRTFRIGIATDSTIAIDQGEQMARWTEYLGAVQSIIGEVEQISQYRPELMLPMVESAKGAVRVLRAGKAIQGAWDKAFDDIMAHDQQAAEQAAQTPPPPDYEMLKIQNEQAKIQASATDSQIKGAELQFNQWEKTQRLQLDAEKIQGDIQVRTEANQIANAANMSKAQIDQLTANIELFSQQFEQKMAEQQLQLKVVEQAHLAKEDQIATMKIVSDHMAAIAQERTAADASSASKTAAPPVHVNTGTVHIGGADTEEEIVAAKDPVTGVWRGRKRKIPSSEAQPA
jgi:hypothetical protein